MRSESTSGFCQLASYLGLFQASAFLVLAVGCDSSESNLPASDSEAQLVHNTTEASPSSSNPATAEPETKTVESEDLKVMVKLFHEHHDAEGKGPSSWDSFITWTQAKDPAAASTLRGLKELGVTFSCEQEIRKASNGTSNTIFAYCNQVPSEGGLVVFMDGSVTSITAEEFKQKLDMQKQFAPSNAAKMSN